MPRQTLKVFGTDLNLLNAAGPAMIDAAVAFGPYRLELGRRVLSKNGKRVALSGRGLDILCDLAQAGSEPVEKDELLARIWPGSGVGENNLHVHISALRKLLGEVGRTHLVTLPGLGYQLLTSDTQRAPTWASSGRPALAVMMFRSLSGGTDAQSIAEGLRCDHPADTEPLPLRGHR
jgi:DNA-binding winged helix-turn-helix (wHTH) protein